MLKLSKASKMPARSWSLEAKATCPGAVNKDGSLVPACAGCYATTGNYRFPNVKNIRVHNREDWKRDDWGPDMVKALEKDKYFRWFDSGDLYNIVLGWKIYHVCKATPHVKHWIPTRMHKFPKFQPVLAALESLDNVVVRKSSDSINGDTVEGASNSSTILPPHITKQAGIDHICPAPSQGGKCGDCRACWDKTVPVVAYHGHGKTMLKLMRES